MDLFAAYELYEEFTLHDVSYLLLGHEPLPPGFPPKKDDQHEVIRHRAKMLASQLMNDAETGKLPATRYDSGRYDIAGSAAERIVKRKDLKDWAKKKMIRPPFLFPELPPLDTVRYVAAAEARAGTQSQVLTLEYKRILLRIAQRINNGHLVAYVQDSDGEFAKLQGDDPLVFQMRGLFAEVGKSGERLPDAHENQPMAERSDAGDLVSPNMDWTERIYIPTDVAPAPKPPTDLQTVSPVKWSQEEAKQDTSTRRDILVPAIEKAIRNAGSEELQAVYLVLRELALNGEPPFSGQIEGGALCYTDSENKQSKLTTAALKKRLYRRRAAHGQ